MIIEILHNKPKTYKIHQLEKGDVFSINDDYYIKVSDSACGVNAFCLSKYSLTTIDDDDIIYHSNVILTIK